MIRFWAILGQIRACWEALGRAFCRGCHRGAINLTKTTYECPVCHREYLYDWYRSAE